MLDIKKIFRRRKKARRPEKQSSPSTVSPSPAPTTILTSPTPPVVSHASNDQNQRLASPSGQTDAVASANPKLVATPFKEQPVGDKKSSKKDVEHKTRKQERALKFLDPIIDGTNIAKNASETAGDASGPLKAAFGITERILIIVRAAVANDKAWVEFMATLEDHKGVLDQNWKLVEKNKQLSQLTAVDSEFAKVLEDYEKSLEEIRVKAEHSAGRFKKKDAKSYFMQPLTAKTQLETIVRLRNELNRSWEFLQGRINLSVRSTTMRVEEHVARMRISQTLQVAEARGNSIGKLLPGTRTDIIQKISIWADDASSGKQIFWLCDGPGTGKSTIAAHMADEWRRKGRFAGGFFFSREDEHTRDLGRFCATIAKQAIELHSRGERYVIDLPKDPSFLPFFDKFDILIKGLIEHLAEGANAPDTASDQAASTSHATKPLMIVIDSLDQCDAGSHVDSSDQTRLLDALLHHLPSLTSVKVLLTSTPLPDVSHRFLESETVLKSEVSAHRAASSRLDIELYVRDRLGGVLTTHQQDQVIESSDGVFQLASVSCRILEKAIHQTSALAHIVSMKHDSTFSNMYTTLLDTIKEEQWNIEEAINTVRTVLQAVVLAYRPVTIATHHSFLPKIDGLPNDYVQRIIGWLNGIVKVGGDEGEGPVYILHPTFRVYLLGLHPGETFNIAAPAGHAFMATGCFKLLEKLEYDLCGVAHNREIPLPVSNGLEVPRQVLERFGTDNSTPLRYAVVFWARHAAEGLVDEDMRTNLVPFFQNQLLKWIEWAATIRELPDCIVGLEELAKRLGPRVNLYSNPLEISALKWCEDALHFVKCQKSIIDQSSMQVYYSALAFDKPGSLVQSHYRTLSPHALPNVVGHSVVVHAGGVTATAVSRSGDVIASAGNDLLIRLWRGDRQEAMSIVLEGSNGVITSMAFSSDGKCLASGSIDGMLSVWRIDEDRGSTLVAALAGTGSEVECLAFSDDDESFICGCRDGTIGVWSIPEKRGVSSYAIPPLTSITDEGVTNDLPDNSTCFIAISKDHRTIALSRGRQLRVFQAENQALSEFLTIRYGRPAQPLFSCVLSTSAINAAPTGSYLYWGDWVLDLGDYQRDLHRFISKASDWEVNHSSKLDFAGPVTRPASLLYFAKQPTRVSSYRLDEDAGVLLLPPEMDLSCWASTRTKIVVGTGDGTVVLVEFADWSILGNEGDGFVVDEPNSDDGYETASGGPGEGAGQGV